MQNATFTSALLALQVQLARENGASHGHVEALLAL
jgi:hypothetical protein